MKTNQTQQKPSQETHQLLLLKSREAANVLAISERTLWKLADEGDIACVRFGRNKRFDPIVSVAAR